MSFGAQLDARLFPVALEITPPQTLLRGVLLRRAGLLGATASAVNVIQRPGRVSSLDASLALHAEGIAPAWHLVTRGRTRSELRADIAAARNGGIGHVLVIRGDHDAPDGADVPTIRETIENLHEELPEALIGATMNQFAPDPAAVLRNLLPKVDAGASYVQTQPVFDLEQLRPLAEELKSRRPDVRIVAMAMPLVSAEALERVTARLGVPVPGAFGERLTDDPASAWPAFNDLMASLAANPLVDGVAIMTYEMDAPPEMGARIVEALRAASLPG